MKLLTVRDILDRTGYRKEDVVYGWINNRDLAAFRAPSKRGGRPQWRVREEDFLAFVNRNIQPAHDPTNAKPPASSAGGSGRLRRSLGLN